MVNADVDLTVCHGKSGRISKRQSEAAGEKYISFDVMAMAVTDCSPKINQVHSIYKYYFRNRIPGFNMIYFELLCQTLGL